MTPTTVPPPPTMPEGAPAWMPPHPPTAIPPVAAPPLTPGRVLGALCAAAAMQFAAVVAAFAALLIWLLSVTEGFFETREEPLWWGVFALPVLILGFALWIGSGAVAARITRRRAGWIVLLMLPAVPTIASSVAALI